MTTGTLESGKLKQSTRIVVVDDVRPLLDAIEDFLTLCGHEVVAFQQGMAALDYLNNNGDDVDLLLTDVVMPEMSGVQLARITKERWPNIRILIMTGQVRNPEEQHFLQSHSGQWLSKPFSLEQLETMLDKVLA